MNAQLLTQAMQRVAILGAGGKMGKGIALLLLQEMAKQEAMLTGNVGMYRLKLIDVDESISHPLKHYLCLHLTRYAEKNINSLRGYYERNPHLVSNEDIIQAFVKGGMDIVFFDTDIREARDSLLIFEAIQEDLVEKVKVLKTLQGVCSPQTYFLTNTSSIPIHVLQEQASLQKRIIGFHFYNPPHIQKLVEVVVPEDVNVDFVTLATELGHRLGKIMVSANDVAGFIGNGHFMREICYACDQVQELAQQYSLTEAIYMINRLTHDFLVRPMGIFQLIDYVGIDVCQKIATVMGHFIPGESFHRPLIAALLKHGIRGGQHSDGSQRDGFFQYEKNVPKSIYSLTEKKYCPLEEVAASGNLALGSLPQGYLPWKKLVRDSFHQDKLRIYFSKLFEEQTLGANLARAFLCKSQEIAKQLVRDKVCQSMQEVNAVLENGFYHLYSLQECCV